MIEMIDMVGMGLVYVGLAISAVLFSLSLYAYFGIAHYEITKWWSKRTSG